MMVRAALEAARVVFAVSRGGVTSDATSAPEWVPLAADLQTSHARAERMWAASVAVLQAATGRPELAGQALVGEARKRELLTLSDAHALIALQGWVERCRDHEGVEAIGTAEREVAREAFMALEHAADVTTRVAMPKQSDTPVVVRPPEPPASSVVAAPSRASTPHAVAGPPPHRRMGLLALTCVVGALAAAGVWYASRTRESGDFRDGVAAYERGAREVARMAFAREAQQHPNDARSLVFLGRIAREDGDLTRAKRFLEAAVRADPRGTLANRELASTLLTDGQPELARRFYVRALQQDPNDKLSQGFLGCALLRLGRVDESRRWFDRAGVGDWTGRCMPTDTSLAPP